MENADELDRIGWSNNKIVSELYSLTSAGVWVSNRDTSGYQSDLSQILAYVTSAMRYNGVGAGALVDHTNIWTTDVTASYARKRVGYKDITLAGGSAADQSLVPALAGYYGVMRILAIGSNTPDTYTWTFQDEDNTLLAGGISGVLMPEVTLAHVPVNLYPGYVFTQATKTDNKALEVDVTGGAGVEHVIIIYEYWYET